jgi:hypothetical protein
MNEEEGRKIILDFLKERENEKYTINSLCTALKKEYPELSLTYYQVAIMTENLIASKQLKSIDFGYKVVWYEAKTKQ